ncbi:hypothetical protein Brsp06_02133 [Brucella sp. NBRC 13694]|uniref:helix-turn-helix domain-containing protein n=1 Tax=Brucella TaxID=234 RepID=UPI001F2BC757|nr:helix-turn-helix domain-containing protein [Brucella anthropi]
MSGPRLSIIPARAATDKALKPRDLQVLCVLGRHTDDLGWCRRSQVKMANEMGCARATVFESINRLIDAGYLERHVQESDSGRDSAHLYRVVLDPKHPDPASVSDADEPCRYVGTPAGISAPPAALEPAPPAGSGPAPINDPSLTTPLNEEKKGSERENPEGMENQPRSSGEDDPKTAAFERRVIRFCNGVGYQAGIWPKWDNKTTLDWIKRQFAGISPDERKQAERWRDAYLLDAAERKVKPQPVGTFFRDRMWNALDPEIILRAERAAAAQKAKEAREASQRPVGWAKCLGPVGMARLFAFLLDGPSDASMVSGLPMTDWQLSKAWPSVHGFKITMQQKGGIVFGQRWHDLARTLEPVPRDTDVLEAWREEFRAKGWPWLSAFDSAPVVFCPKGGPAALHEFESALRGLGEHDGN